MKIVIQCAATKNPAPFGSGFRTNDNRLVKFVAHPELAPKSEMEAYARPDDLTGSQTWRERLLDYNKDPAANPLNFLPAYRLYANKAYADLVAKFGLDQVFILSAGWGIIPASFLTPDYDITFSHAKNVDAHCRRAKSDTYADICLLPDDGDVIVFLGGKDYLPLFSRLTSALKGAKKVFFNSQIESKLGSGFRLEKFSTSQRTNWHYQCAQAMIDGKI